MQINDRYMKVRRNLIEDKIKSARRDLDDAMKQMQRGMDETKDNLKRLDGGETGLFFEDLNVGQRAQKLISANYRYGAARQELADLDQLISVSQEGQS